MSADDPGKSGAWLKVQPRLRARLAVLSADAFVVLHKVWLYCQDVGNGGRFHLDELPAACDRLFPPARLNRALAELHRVTRERSNGDGTTTKVPMWLDLIDDHVVLPDWWLNDNPPPVVYHDDVLFWRHKRNARLNSPSCGDLRADVKKRDRNLCRYCGVRVQWGANNSPAGGTYDHVDPDVDNTTSNVVVACRRCNGRKRDRTPEQWIADDPAEGASLLRPGTTADQAAAQRASSRDGPPSSPTQVRHESNSPSRTRASPPRSELVPNSTRLVSGSTSARPASGARSRQRAAPRTPPPDDDYPGGPHR